jgi:RHS repeat-associated protein
MQYTGEHHDPTGLYHLRARQYDPITGRFLILDPLTPDQQTPFGSSYAYVGNRPTVMVDPTGKTSEPSTDALRATALASSPGDAEHLSDTSVSPSFVPGADYMRIPSSCVLNRCPFGQRVDYPHFSITAFRLGRYEYVVKARWLYRGGPARVARLTLWLQWKPSGGGWLNMGRPTVATVSAGKDVVKATKCVPNEVRTLRGALDTDIVGYNDPGGNAHSSERIVKCAP